MIKVYARGSIFQGPGHPNARGWKGAMDPNSTIR